MPISDIYRVGNHQPQNVYRGDQYIGVMFSPEDAAAVVQMLNLHECLACPPSCGSCSHDPDCECYEHQGLHPGNEPATAATPIRLERVRTDDGAYRVFEPRGAGTGAVTYDPSNGDYGYIEVDGTLSQEFNADAEERLCHDVLETRGDDAVFERLEYVYQRQRERAATVTRPNAAGVVPGGTA